MHTQNYGLPLLQTNQAMKEITINTALNKLDWLLNRAAIGFISELCAGSLGDMYIIKDAAISLAQHQNKIAIFLEDGWNFFSPSRFTVIYIERQKALHMFDGATWVKI